MKTINNCKGFTLVEVLVAAFVLAIGLLGLAGLQAKSLQFNQSAYQRSQASILAYDIIDRMRANLTEARNGTYTIAEGDGPPTATNCQAGGATCITSTMATFDLAQWKCSIGSYDDDSACKGFGIEGALLEGTGAVATNGNVVTVTIKWTDDRTKEGDDRLTTFTASTVL
jgi:type IV pilus assembly protein PilV